MAISLRGSLAGVVGIPIVAYLSGHGAWNTAFLLGTGFALASAVAWLFIDARRRVETELPGADAKLAVITAAGE